jgi:hypothetical protein
MCDNITYLFLKGSYKKRTINFLLIECIPVFIIKKILFKEH